MNINNVNDLMTHAAEATRDMDADRLEELLRISAGWLQPEEDRAAQEAMLMAMLDRVYEALEG